MNALLLLALGTLIGLAYILIRLAIWGLVAPRLSACADPLESWPCVSVVIAGRNEERNVAAALKSVVALDYPNLEIIFVNDRSTDRTGEIVRELAAHVPRLHVVDIEELPAGWLGKNHALEIGAERATGDFLLFTDADVIFDARVLRLAVACMERRGIDHLASGFKVIAPTLRLRLFVAGFMFFFLLYARPWAARNPRSKGHVGVGGFNLVRTALYRRAGGHRPIAMRPDDDMMLGKLLKMNGARQELIDPEGMLQVEWYSSLREAARGFEKNSFAGFGYSVARLIAGTIGAFAVSVWPFIGVFVTSGPARWANVAIAAIVILTVGALARHSGIGNLFYGLAFPFAALAFMAMFWRASLLTLKNGGVRWKDTFYSLEELRANRI